MVSSWHLAPSLTVLRGEVDYLWPNRDKASDGTVGDAAHQGTSSDHNPNLRGSVNAWDMDVDGPDVWRVIRAFQEHPSAHYWIYNRKIADVDNDWRQLYYSGSNPHDRHVHFSIKQALWAERDVRPWGLAQEDAVTEAEIIRAVRLGIHGLLNEASEGSSQTGRDVRNDIWNILQGEGTPLGARLSAIDQTVDAIYATPPLDPTRFVAALIASPEALTALTQAMRDQLPLIPTAQEIAKAFVTVISAGIHNGQS